uniref:Uncharacterized protein n=1 Tax=Anguilla anguilla TaxID=7936 RepID=A0A0E9U770_ANGAN
MLDHPYNLNSSGSGFILDGSVAASIHPEEH